MTWWLIQNVPGFARLYYRYRCPYPINGNRTARSCVNAGLCGCDNYQH